MEALRDALDDLTVLFTDMVESTCIECRDRKIDSGSLLAPDHWEHTRDEHILVPGFTFSDQHLLTITHRISLNGYVHGTDDFNVGVSCHWVFDSDAMSRSLVIDDEPLDGPERVGYSELGVRSVRIDRVCTIVLRQARTAIEAR